ncbi:MAG: cell division protein FtsL [Bacilli bacterium]|nr:cell division protein FtsL [Bacilli bacterium]
MTKNKNLKKITIIKGEKILYLLLVLLVIAVPISNVFIKALLSESNIEVEQLKSKIDKQTNLNEGLNMQINELASLDKIQEVAKNIGLSYNNDNIKVINN